MTELTNRPGPTGLPPGDGSDDPQPRSGGDVVGGETDGSGTIADRLGRNPGNLGDEVPDLGDVTHPAPEPGTAQM
jgi:hypothetical protein